MIDLTNQFSHAIQKQTAVRNLFRLVFRRPKRFYYSENDVEAISELINDCRENSEKQLRIGVIGTGKMAQTWIACILEGAREYGVTISAVFSRTRENGESFAKRFGIPKVYTQLEDLISSRNVDAVYIATPNDCHYQHIAAALNGGLHVLCEKPITIRVSELTELQQLAYEKHLVLLEGMWMRCLPAIHKIKQLIDIGAIGVPMCISAQVCNAYTEQERPDLFSKNGGGALLDVGCYCLHLALMMFGKPESYRAVTIMQNASADVCSTITFTYPDHRFANMVQSIAAMNKTAATFSGTCGYISADLFLYGGEFALRKKGERRTILYRYHPQKSYNKDYMFELLSFKDCIQRGRDDNPLIPNADSLLVIRILEEAKHNSDNTLIRAL